MGKRYVLVEVKDERMGCMPFVLLALGLVLLAPGILFAALIDLLVPLSSGEIWLTSILVSATILGVLSAGRESGTFVAYVKVTAAAVVATLLLLTVPGKLGSENTLGKMFSVFTEAEDPRVQKRPVAATRPQRPEPPAAQEPQAETPVVATPEVAEPEPEIVRTRRAAEQGDPRAQTRLGQMYFNGDGVAEDASEAVSWFRQAADQGHPLARIALSVALTYGRGTARDAEAAKRLLLDVLADTGAPADRDIQANALYNLGELFYAGEEFGTVSDPSTAKATWLRLSPWADEENRHVRLAAAGIACIDAGTPAAACEPLRCSIEGRRDCAAPGAAAQYPPVNANRVPPRLEVGRSPPTDDFYPPAARQEGIEGVTTVRACVGRNGRTSGEPTVITSSGHDSLDEAALRWAARARWTPGTEEGKRVEMCSQFNVRFALTD